jgi:sulfite exporter TauE/SafE
LKQIQQKIEKLGYTISSQPTKKSNIKLSASKKQWVYALIIVFILYKLYSGLQKTGLLSFFDSTESVGYGAAFLIGIVASLSTCLAIIGAVVISFGAKYQRAGTKFERTIQPHLLFHVGRVASFFVLGGLLGLLGSIFTFSPFIMAWFSLLIAFILIWLGLNILGFAPSLTAAGIHMPKKFLRHWQRLENSEHHLAPAILGAATFFLPCGFTQSMQLLAMTSGSFWIGGMTLAAFALGTLPVLLGIGIISSKSQNKKYTVFKLVTGIIIVLFGWYSLSAASAILGISLPTIGSNTVSTGQDTTPLQSTENVQTVYMTVDYSGYTPNTIRIKNNVPVRWIIDVTQISGCTNEIIIPTLGLSKKLTTGKNYVTFTPRKKGRLGFSCWMGMVRGTFIVE